jgi:hypothetical protein
MALMPGAVHIVAGQLRPEALAGPIRRAEDAARELGRAPGVEAVVLGRADDRLVVATWLEGRDALEAFAASREHMSFVMQGLAPVISGMWSAAIEADSELPPADTASLWVWALPARDGVYEWQVRDLLAVVEALPGVATAGPTVEERERFRAGGVVCLRPDALTVFDERVEQPRREWTAVVGSLEEAQAPVVFASVGA